MSLVTRFVPEPSLEERRAALIAASKLAWARGVTSEVDCGRFSPGETAQQAWDDLMALVEQRRSPGSRQLHVGGVKTFADGSLGSGSALFHDILTGFLNLSWKQTVLDIRLQFMPLEMQQMIKFSVVSPPDPLRGIQTAMRRDPNGWQSPWIPFEIISSETPLTGYTVGAAYASFMDTHVGSLSPGKYADFRCVIP
ncbi:unnamed protein product [Sphagnum tenellum]